MGGDFECDAVSAARSETAGQAAVEQEEWDGVDENGDAHESPNRYSKGAVIQFLHTHTLGLRQAEGSAAWERFAVAPVPHSSVGWARSTFDSPRGTIVVEWRIQGGELDISERCAS